EPGIDIKGERGYIVVAPSIHPDTGLEYFWHQHPREGIADAPPWLMERLLGQKDQKAGLRSTVLQKPNAASTRVRRISKAAHTSVRHKVKTASPAQGNLPGAWRTGDHAKLLNEMKQKFPISGRGHRHGQMVRAVGSLVGREYDEGMIVSVMMDWWEFFYAQDLTGTDRPHMEAELAACLGSTHRNNKFTVGRGDDWHRRRYRKIQLSEKQRRLMKASIVTDKSGSRSLGTDSGYRPRPHTHTCKTVTHIENRVCKSDD